jgi:hypothetical protein
MPVAGDGVDAGSSATAPTEWTVIPPGSLNNASHIVELVARGQMTHAAGEKRLAVIALRKGKAPASLRPTSQPNLPSPPPTMTTAAATEPPRAEAYPPPQPCAPRRVVRLSGSLAALFALVGRAEGTELWEGKLLGRLRAAGLIACASPPGDGHGTAATAERAPARLVVRLSGALAALLGTLWELWEDELLGRLRGKGMITYPSPLLQHLDTPAAVAERRRRYVARLSVALAALLGHAAGAELSEDGLLGGLRAAGLITYPPSPLLSPHHLLLVRLSGALAEQLAGPHLANTSYPSELNFDTPCAKSNCQFMSHFILKIAVVIN